MKIIISAYACEPNEGSEPGVGWSWIKQISETHEVWALTRANNQAPIDRALKDEPMPNVHWVYFDLPGWMRFWKRGQQGVRVYYYLWQLAAYFVARRLDKRVNFDLVHHLTFGVYWMPSFMVLLGKPFIWGPLGGGESAPPSFHRTFSWRGKVYELARSLARWLGEHDPIVRLAARRAKVCLAKAQETADRLVRIGATKVELCSEVAFTRDELREFNVRGSEKDDLFIILSVGRLLHLKGFHLSLSAFARIQESIPESQYWIIGEGPERERLARLSERLAVDARVRLLGRMSRGEVLSELAKASIFVHPSLHDSGGWVCLEAMASQKPVIFFDLGGPAFQVSERAGICVEAANPDQAIEDIANAMLRMYNEPELRKEMGRAGAKRVEEDFTWETKIARIDRVYRLTI